MEGNTAPPNYNPNDTLLKGGESVPITPVQGGGGLNGSVPPPSYNPNETMLNGGDSVPIVAVRGGAAPFQTQTHKNNDENNNVAYIENNNDNANTSSTIAQSNNENNTISNNENENENDNTSSTNAQSNNENINTLSTFNNNNNNNNANSTNALSNNETDNFSTISSVTNKNAVNDALSDEDEKPPKTPCDLPTDESIQAALEELDDTFQASDTPNPGSGKTVKLKVKAVNYELRLPERDTSLEKKDYKDPIYNDWSLGTFTNDEADFLNSLGLSPKLLYLTFSCLVRDWGFELADFLYFLTVESCSPERFTVTHARCQKVREFLALVGAQMCVEKLRKVQVTRPKVPPVEGSFLPPINTEQDEEEEEETKKPKGKEEEEPHNTEDEEKPGEKGPNSNTEENNNDDESVISALSNDIQGLQNQTTTIGKAVQNIKKEVPAGKRTPGFFNKVKAYFGFSETEPWAKTLKEEVFTEDDEEEKDDDTVLENIKPQIKALQDGKKNVDDVVDDIKQEVPAGKRTPGFFDKLKAYFGASGTEPWAKNLKEEVFTEDEEEKDDDTVLENIKPQIKALQDGKKNVEDVVDDIKQEVPAGKRTPGFFDKLKAYFGVSGTEPWAKNLKEEVFTEDDEEEKDDDTVLENIKPQIKALQDGKKNVEDVVNDIKQEVPAGKRTPGFFDKVKAYFGASGTEPWAKTLEEDVFIEEEEEKKPTKDNEGDNEETKPKNANNDDRNNTYILNSLTDDVEALKTKKKDINQVIEDMKRNIPKEKRNPSFLKKVQYWHHIDDDDPFLKPLQEKVFTEKDPVFNNERQRRADELFEKIIQQIELAASGNLGKEAVLRSIVKDLPEEYQTEEFMEKLVNEAIIKPKDPWYKKLSRKFFGKGGTRIVKKRSMKHFTKKIRKNR